MLTGGLFAIPMISSTAMVSPSARPQPSRAEAMMPVRTYGMVTTRTISYLVMPSARAPSLASTGTRLTSCRVVEAMIGMIMRVRTSEAVSNPWPL